jgi:hypothetical protein
MLAPAGFREFRSLNMININIRATLRSVALVGAGASTLMVGQVAQAHHSFGLFEMQKSITIEGTVKTVQWTNPHIWIDVVTIDRRTRQPVIISVEGDAVAIMKRKGWSRDSLKAGDKVAIVAHPLKTGQPGGALVSATVGGKPIGNGSEYRSL